MGRRGGESGDHQEEAEKGKRTHTAQAQGNRREGWRSNREATQTGDSTLREGQLGSAPAVSQAKVDGRQLQCRARLNTSETRQRMGRLTDTKVRGFMVTETNNDTCAQLQPVLSTHCPCAHAPTSKRLAPVRWAVGPFLSIPIKVNSGR